MFFWFDEFSVFPYEILFSDWKNAWKYHVIQIRSSNALLFIVTKVCSSKLFVVIAFFPLVIIDSGSFSQMKQIDFAGSKK